MKNFALFLVGILFSFNSFSQRPDNQFYFRLGYSSPTWNQYGMNKSLKVEGVDKFGANFEFGNIFMLHSLLPTRNMALGINVDYLYTNVNNFQYQDNTLEQNFSTFRVGSKIGPSFTYSLSRKAAFDAFVKANVAWATVAVPYQKKINDADDYYSDYATVGISTGLNFRYGILMLGIEYETISPELESNEYEGVYLQTMIKTLAGEGDDGSKSKLPCVNFMVGLSF